MTNFVLTGVRQNFNLDKFHTNRLRPWQISKPTYFTRNKFCANRLRPWRMSASQSSRNRLHLHTPSSRYVYINVSPTDRLRALVKYYFALTNFTRTFNLLTILTLTSAFTLSLSSVIARWLAYRARSATESLEQDQAARRKTDEQSNVLYCVSVCVCVCVCVWDGPAEWRFAWSMQYSYIDLYMDIKNMGLVRID